MSENPPDQPLRVDPVDEGRHEHTDDPLWSESYYLDAISDDGTVGVYARIGDTRNLGRSLVSFVIVRPGHPTVTVNDDQAPLPAWEGRKLTVEAPAYRITFDTPEAVATSRVTFAGTAHQHDDPGAVLRDEPGTAVQVAADLTWASDGIDYQWKVTTRYEIPCRVTGTITLDGEEFTFAGDGQRDHSWGPRDWWGMCWMWSAFRLDDGTALHAVNMRDTDWTFGYSQRDGQLIELASGVASQDYRGEGTVSGATIRLNDLDLDLTAVPFGYGNLRLVAADGTVAHFVRAMTDVTTSDGRTGRGWMEWEFVESAEAPHGFR